MTEAIGSAQAAANFFLGKAAKERRPITPLQLLKLVYIAHGWCLGLLDRPLFDDDVQAWKHGPVVPSIYHEFKHWGGEPIKELAVNLDEEGAIYIPQINPTEIEALAVLNKVWDVYGKMSGYTLRSLTHEIGTPWQKHYRENARYVCIPNDEIKIHYRDVLSEVARSVETASSR